MKTQSLFNKCFVTLVFLIGLIGTTSLNAQTTFTAGNLNYRINDDCVSVTVTGHIYGQNATGELTIPSSVSYNGNNFDVTIIDEYAFEYCVGFTGDLVIPNSVTLIGGYAFIGCRGFNGNIILSNSLTEIGVEAFSRCLGLVGDLIIPSSVELLSTDSFSRCQFDGISVESDNNVYDSRDNCQAIIKTSTNELVFGCKNTIISNSVTSIGEYAFCHCNGLFSIDIPNSVTSIGAYAFGHCSALSTVNLANSLLEIGEAAFAYCSALTMITIPNSVLIIGNSAFENSGLTGIVTIPDSVIHIGESAFSWTEGIDGFYVESGNSVYDSRDNCNAIIKTNKNELVIGCKNTTIPNSVTSIGEYAFNGCSGLTSINIPSSVMTIGYCAFKSCQNAVSLIIPDSVISIGAYAFCMCYSLSGDLLIPNSVQEIGERAFDWCYRYDGTLIIGSGVVSIGDCAFNNCYGFTAAISLATVPPALDNSSWNYAFTNFGTTTLTVPCGCVSAYENSLWHNNFTTIIEDCSAADELDENLASVYPNPTSSIVKIEAENIQIISIYNISGKLMFESAATGNEFEYDFGNAESGAYIVRIETAQGIATKRVTVK